MWNDVYITGSASQVYVDVNWHLSDIILVSLMKIGRGKKHTSAFRNLTVLLLPLRKPPPTDAYCKSQLKFDCGTGLYGAVSRIHGIL